MFKAVSTKSSFPEIEENIQKFWEENKIFQKSLENRKGSDEFVFYDGPPFATGLPHYGHLLAGTIKDVVPRYQTMRGKFVDRVFGWDCHGLPVEYEMEKTLNLSGKKDIENFGIDKFNEACRSIVLRYTGEWETIVRRMGRWVDFQRGYRTMDKDYMESIWWVFKQLWDKGYIYEGHRILPYCPRCATPLSNFEANQGYVEVEDPAITIRFQDEKEHNLFYLAWTTTPWTLPSNMALAVGPEVDYVKIADGNIFYILAEARLPFYYKEKSEYTIISKFKGAALLNRAYVPLFPYFSELREEGAFRIITADYVSTEDGTGIVHTATGFGEDDAAAGKKHGIPEVCPIDPECKFTASISDYEGMYVKDTDKLIIKRLKEEGKLVHRGTIKHNYPHCWRDDSPLIYRAIPSWFVEIDKIKEKMLNANSKITWVPSHIKDGRFGKWLENARDWTISRNRYWGCPLPIWRNEDTDEIICVGSVAELEKLCGKKVDDIHKHFVDPIEIPSPTGKGILKRVPEVLDCWFESGSMPYAQNHYPFENKELFEKNYPADFIAEGLDQTRGWFYTLVVLGAALFDKPAFKNVIVNGLILAEDGQKMSKRKKNYPDPMYVINQYGADALRLFMLGSPVVKADDLRFSEEGVRETLRTVMLPIWNSYSFFTTYARVDNYEPKAGEVLPPENPSNPLDRWILSSLCQMVSEIKESMDVYQLQKAANRFSLFVEDLTNWYIRRSRRRFWKSQNDSDKEEAYQTLHFVLLTFVKTACPFIPFMTEEIYQNLKTDKMPESVHLCNYPELDSSMRDESLEIQMGHAITAVSLGRYLRTKREIKVRQPLSKAIFICHEESILKLMEGTVDIIKDELNVKSVEFMRNEEELVDRSAKANFKLLGPKVGKNMKEVAERITKLTNHQIVNIINDKVVALVLSSGSKIEIGRDDVIIVRKEKEGLTAATEKNITVALDINLTKELKEEGFAREIVSKIQNKRKEMNLDVSDRIVISYGVPAEWENAILKFADYIKNETLASTLEKVTSLDCAELTEVNDVNCILKARKS
ncbi:MAG TPA: isoleucine--tRNA ligase [Lentisphaeria bacterium]|nr:MAG: isoleucine--tRNA ligase [Lentisphaerae bacterium GWF2_38_69]HBM17016.1 isoleucine--tRNA ligase [Lentisphaeria bacterium]